MTTASHPLFQRSGGLHVRATCEHLGPFLITAHPDEILTLFLALVKLAGGPNFEALA